MKAFIVLLVLLFTGLYFTRSGQPEIDYKKAYEAQLSVISKPQAPVPAPPARDEKWEALEKKLEETERKFKEANAKMEASKAALEEQVKKQRSAVVVPSEEQRIAAQDRAWAESKARAVNVWPQAADPNSELSRMAMQIQEEYIAKNNASFLEHHDSPFTLYSMAAKRLLDKMAVPDYAVDAEPRIIREIVQQVPVYVPVHDKKANTLRQMSDDLGRANMQNEMYQMRYNQKSEAMSERNLKMHQSR